MISNSWKQITKCCISKLSFSFLLDILKFTGDTLLGEFFNVQVLGELCTSMHFTTPGGGWCYRDVLTGDEGVSQAHEEAPWPDSAGWLMCKASDQQSCQPNIYITGRKGVRERKIVYSRLGSREESDRNCHLSFLFPQQSTSHQQAKISLEGDHRSSHWKDLTLRCMKVVRVVHIRTFGLGMFLEAWEFVNCWHLPGFWFLYLCLFVLWPGGRSSLPAWQGFH